MVEIRSWQLLAKLEPIDNEHDKDKENDGSSI